MASPASCTRSAGPGTCFVLERFSIRWRLALISAALTFVILCGFAVVVGQLTAGRIRSDFRNEAENAATELRDRLSVTIGAGGRIEINPDLDLYAAPNNAVIRIFDGRRIPFPQASTPKAPDLGPPVQPGSGERGGYLVETRYRVLESSSGLSAPVWIEYARPLRDVKNAIAGLRIFLAFGVGVGTLLALLGGLALAKRSLRPITALTATARDIARTRDPARRVPEPTSDDEVAELARTFDEMLEGLEASRNETEGALDRQRQFVADASHELRTPLTSVLANLELLTEELEGDPRETAEAALRSSRRMRRLVADLLLLARSDGAAEQRRRPLDLSAVALDAISEAGAIADGHELELKTAPGVVVEGARDELHRLALNLIENALSHTPPGTVVRVRTSASGSEAVLTVEDDGPGVPAEMRPKIFDRFVRAGGDTSRSTGLGLAIVQAVATGHGGTVTLEDAQPGARFIVRLPLVDAAPEPPTDELGEPSTPAPAPAPAEAATGGRAAALARGIRRLPARRS